MTIIQDERFDYIKRLLERDLSTYSGPILEKLFIEIMNLATRYGIIGTYWEKGNINEIDVVAIDDLSKEIYFAEVKLNKDKIKLGNLEEKSMRLLSKYAGYNPVYEGLSISDINRKIEENKTLLP